MNDAQNRNLLKKKKGATDSRGAVQPKEVVQLPLAFPFTSTSHAPRRDAVTDDGQSERAHTLQATEGNVTLGIKSSSFFFFLGNFVNNCTDKVDDY